MTSELNFNKEKLLLAKKRFRDCYKETKSIIKDID